MHTFKALQLAGNCSMYGLVSINDGFSVNWYIVCIWLLLLLLLLLHTSFLLCCYNSFLCIIIFLVMNTHCSFHFLATPLGILYTIIKFPIPLGHTFTF